MTAPSVGTVVINGGSAPRCTVRSVVVNFVSLVVFVAFSVEI